MPRLSNETALFMSLKAKIEAIVYAAEEPVTVDQIFGVVADEVSAEQRAQQADTALPLETHDDIRPHPMPEPHVEAEKNSADAKQQRERGRRRVREILEQLVADYDSPEHGLEIRQVAGGYRMSTKPEHHDVVRSFAKSLKSPIRLSLQALETLAVIAYKQPVTAPEISEIRGVDCSGVLANLIARKLITTAGRKQVIGRPILYKTTKDFLLRFGLKDLNELPSIEEFEKLTSAQTDLLTVEGGVADATGVPDVPDQAEGGQRQRTSSSNGENSNAEGHYEEKVIESSRSE
ncbi:MAG: SMC-Scp complex subunit ScpB [Acidobacteria bacterium 13_1_20CM_4_56_7]|jgi:segregation and condensation protein B|nr:MAG: SMC-Scp complex subunit ScpB [Acidobacteria bacterium 13_1_20CM_4_56_7]